MARELQASVMLDLVDRISGPVRRIQQRFTRLGRARGLQQLRQSMANVSQQWGNVNDQTGKLTRRIGVLSGVAAGTAWSLERLVSGVTDAGTQALQSADRLGVAVSWLSEWQRIGKRFGVQEDALADGLKEISMRADEFVATAGGPAAEAFSRLGITDAQLRDTQGRTDAIFDLVVERMRGIDNVSTRQRLADELFGGQGGEQMVAMLSSSREELARLRGEVRASGAVMDRELGEGSQRYTRRIQAFTETLQGLRQVVVRQLLPSLTDWAARTTEIIQNNRELITRRLLDGLRQFWDGLQGVGRMLAWTADLLGGWGKLALLITAIMAGPLLWALAQFVVVTGKLSVVLTGLALKAIPAVVGAVKALGAALLTTPVGWVIAAVAAIGAAVYLIYRYWEPITAFVRDLWADITGIFYRALAWITRTLNPTALAAAGRDWISGMLDGVIEKLIALRNAVERRIQRIVDWIAETLSPSALVAVGRDWIDGLWRGMAEQFNALNRWLEQKMAGLTAWMPEWVKEPLNIADPAAAPAAPGLGSNLLDDQAVDGAMAVMGETRVGGELRITIDSEGQPRVDDLRRDGPMDIDVDLGNWRSWP